MITIDQIKELHGRVDTLRHCLDIDSKRAKVAEMEKESLAPLFWDDPKSAESFLKEMNAVKSWVTSFDAMAMAAEDVEGG